MASKTVFEPSLSQYQHARSIAQLLPDAEQREAPREKAVWRIHFILSPTDLSALIAAYPPQRKRGFWEMFWDTEELTLLRNGWWLKRRTSGSSFAWSLTVSKSEEAKFNCFIEVKEKNLILNRLKQLVETVTAPNNEIEGLNWVCRKGIPRYHPIHSLQERGIFPLHRLLLFLQQLLLCFGHLESVSASSDFEEGLLLDLEAVHPLVPVRSSALRRLFYHRHARNMWQIFAKLHQLNESNNNPYYAKDPLSVEEEGKEEEQQKFKAEVAEFQAKGYSTSAAITIVQLIRLRQRGEEEEEQEQEGEEEQEEEEEEEQEKEEQEEEQVSQGERREGR